MAPILFLFVVLGTLAAGALILYASLTTRPLLRRTVVRLWGTVLVLYAISLLAVSLTSRETVLAQGERKAFCGFYLDCHLGVAVEHVEWTAAGAAERLAVTIRISSDARRAALRLVRPRAVVLDDHGNRYEPDGLPKEMENDLTTGEGLSFTPSYAVPTDAGPLRLYVTEGFGIDHVIEAFLIGDEDSLFHKHVTHALEPAERT